MSKVIAQNKASCAKQKGAANLLKSAFTDEHAVRTKQRASFLVEPIAFSNKRVCQKIKRYRRTFFYNKTGNRDRHIAGDNARTRTGRKISKLSRIRHTCPTRSIADNCPMSCVIPVARTTNPITVLLENPVGIIVPTISSTCHCYYGICGI